MLLFTCFHSSFWFQYMNFSGNYLRNVSWGNCIYLCLFVIEVWRWFVRPQRVWYSYYYVIITTMLCYDVMMLWCSHVELHHLELKSKKNSFLKSFWIFTSFSLFCMYRFHTLCMSLCNKSQIEFDHFSDFSKDDAAILFLKSLFSPPYPSVHQITP